MTNTTRIIRHLTSIIVFLALLPNIVLLPNIAFLPKIVMREYFILDITETI